jgi:hypothetical protein
MPRWNGSSFITVLNDILIPYLKIVFQLNYTQVMLINTCFFGAYFVMSIPSGRIVAEHLRVRNQPARNGAHAFGLARVTVERALLVRFAQHLQVLLLCRLIDLLRRWRQHGHLLLALHTHRTAARGLHRLAAGDSQCHHQGRPCKSSFDLRAHDPLRDIPRVPASRKVLTIS